MKKTAWLTSLCFLGLIFTGFLLLLFGEDRAFSEQENRALQTRPRFTLEGLLSGTVERQTEERYGDQLPGRDRLIGWKGLMEIALGKGENNGILLGKDGRLARGGGELLFANGERFFECDGYDPAHVANACAGIVRAHEALGDRFLAVLTGRNLDIAASAFAYPRAHGIGLEAQLNRELAEVPRAEVISSLRERFQMGEEVYYRTDHHWTTLGAYYAYREVMTRLGLEAEILPMETFRRVGAASSFRGSLWSAGGMRWVKPDSLELWLAGNESELTVTADGRPLPGLYAEEWLSRKDCYSVFLDGTHDIVTVEKKGEDRPRMLLLKDSFANSLAPFLAQHFDLVLLNLSSSRRDFTDLTRRVEEWDADYCLLVYTLENLLSTDKLSRLR
ncbi:MAG: hypothetical protein E7620_05005 [Ruminococcaceae bacterium]|nr:hypothetical protein [Oscillospiraceae bacterium]